MIDEHTATATARAFLAKARRTALVLLEDRTIERPFGWVFFYQSRKFIETGDERERLIGNSPFFVLRDDGSVLVTGTGHPIEDYIDAFERTGELPKRPPAWRHV